MKNSERIEKLERLERRYNSISISLSRCNIAQECLRKEIDALRLALKEYMEYSTSGQLVAGKSFSDYKKETSALISNLIKEIGILKFKDKNPPLYAKGDRVGEFVVTDVSLAGYTVAVNEFIDVAAYWVYGLTNVKTGETISRPESSLCEGKKSSK